MFTHFVIVFCLIKYLLFLFVLFFQMSEPDAFELFRYVMFDLGIRRQYMPDMNAVQVDMLFVISLLRPDNFCEILFTWSNLIICKMTVFSISLLLLFL